MYLVTMPQSPYCERARWALDLLGEPYVEERFPPWQHRNPLKKMHAGKTVPALLVASRDVYPNSDEILNFVNDQMPEDTRLFPVDKVQGPLVRDFCLRCDRELGPLINQIIMFGINNAQFFAWCTNGVTDEASRRFKLWSPLMMFLTKRKFKVDKEHLDDAIFQLNKFFNVADAIFNDGRKFLFVDRFTAADLTFCALVGPILMLPENGGSVLDLAKAKPEVEKEVKRLRATRVGNYVQAVYKRFRKPQLTVV